MATTARLLTYDDYAALPNDGKRYEVIAGELFEMPAPTWAHQELLARLFMLLRGFVTAHRLGTAHFAPVDVLLSPHDVLQPDLLYVSHQRGREYGPKFLRGGPDLVCEVLSPSTRSRDLAVKTRLYAAADVRERWIGDLDVPELRVLRLEDGSYVPIPAVDGVVESVVLPGLRLDVAVLLANLDQMG